MTSPLPSSYLRDIKHPEMRSEKSEDMLINRPSYRRRRPFAIAFASVALCYIIWTTISSSGPGLFRHNCHDAVMRGVRVMDSVPAEGKVVDDDDKKLVPLEAHIMSKCPDARVRFTLFTGQIGWYIDKVH